MASIGLGVTLGSHTLRAVKLKRKGAGFIVQKVFSERVDEATRPAAGRALAARGFSGAPVTLGLSGRDVIIRYSQVPPVPEWRLRNLMKFEVEEVGSQSGGDVSADYRKLNLPDPDGTRGEDTILVALARNRYVDVQMAALASGGLKVSSCCPNSVAMFNAFAVNATYTEEETAILVNVGAENLDIAIQRGGELLFARNATPGAKAFTEALVQAFSTTEGKAETMKLTKGDVTPKAQARYADGTAEKVANAMMGVAGQLSSLIQSTLMIARAQTRMPDLRIDRVLLAGGGASLKGLDLYLKQAMGVPVERFNPFVLCDLSALSADERALAEGQAHEFAVAVGLAQMRLAPSTFVLEVLPAALRRQRDFWTKGIYGVGAAVVMAGVLLVVHQGRTEASSAYEDQAARLRQRLADVKKRDSGVRDSLLAAQDGEIKHRLLAERAAPGVLLSQAWGEVSARLAAAPEIYVQSLKLSLEDPVNEVEWVRPKNAKQPLGYEKVLRTTEPVRGRDSRVVATLRVMANVDKPEQKYTAFVKAIEENQRGLIVRILSRFKPPKSGQDGEFELELWPGETLARVGGAGRPHVLARVRLDDEQNPTAFVGMPAGGVEARVPFAEVDPADLQRVLNERFPGLSPELVKAIKDQAGRAAAGTR
jgi:type IV pilus assembly protein PilM